MSQQRRFIEVTFGEETKLLRFDFNALADLEEHFGKGIRSIMQEENIGFRTIRALYWAGLKWKERGLTIERAGQMIESKLEDGVSFKELMEPIVKALRASGLMSKRSEDGDGDEGPKN